MRSQRKALLPSHASDVARRPWRHRRAAHGYGVAQRLCDNARIHRPGDPSLLRRQKERLLAPLPADLIEGARGGTSPERSRQLDRDRKSRGGGGNSGPGQGAGNPSEGGPMSEAASAQSALTGFNSRWGRRKPKCLQYLGSRGFGWIQTRPRTRWGLAARRCTRGSNAAKNPVSSTAG
jgi:hypothetical protein